MADEPIASVSLRPEERAYLQERRTGIDEARDAFPRQKLAPCDMPLARLGRAALGRRAPALAEFVNQPTPFRSVGFSPAALRCQSALYSRHYALFP